MLAAGGRLDPSAATPAPHPPPSPVPPLPQPAWSLSSLTPPSRVVHDSGLFVGLRFRKGSRLQTFTPISVAPHLLSFDFHLDSENNLGSLPRESDWKGQARLCSLLRGPSVEQMSESSCQSSPHKAMPSPFGFFGLWLGVTLSLLTPGGLSPRLRSGPRKCPTLNPNPPSF